MIWYYFVLSLILLSLYLGKGRINKVNNIIIYFIIPLFICFGYMIGADWRMYEIEFYDISQRLETKEPSYYLLAQLFKSIGFGFWEFSILYKIVGYYVFIHIYRRYSKNNLWGLVYWFPNYALFLWMDHPARNFIAIIIYSCAFFYIEKKSVYKYLMLTVLASSFHATCIVMIPVYYIVRLTPNKNYQYWLVSIVVIYFFTDLLRVYLAPILEILNLMERMRGYLLQEEYIAKMSIIRFAILFTILLVATINIERIRYRVRYADIMLKLSFLYVFFFCIGNIHNIFFRFQYYMMIPMCVIVSYICVYNRNFLKFAAMDYIKYIYIQKLLTQKFLVVSNRNDIKCIIKEKVLNNLRYSTTRNLAFARYGKRDKQRSIRFDYIRNKYISFVIKTFIIVFSFIYMQNLLTRNSHYIPYSSYLEYILKEKPSYNQRSNYNPKYSPYRMGD